MGLGIKSHEASTEYKMNAPEEGRNLPWDAQRRCGTLGCLPKPRVEILGVRFN